MTGTKLRPLGPGEKCSATRSDLGIYLNVSLTAFYKKPPSSTIKKSLFHALGLLINEHPILSVTLAGADTEAPYFIRPVEINLNDLVTFIRNVSCLNAADCQFYIDRLLEGQHNHPFDLEFDRVLPFWRICVVEYSQLPGEFAIIFTFHHSLMDTKSAVIFQTELESHMAQDINPPLVEVVPTPDINLLPTMESVYKLPVSVSQKSFYSDGGSGPSFSNSWTGACQSVPVKSRFSSLHLSKPESDALKRATKAEHTSITATIQAMIASAIFQCLPPRYTEIRAECAVSLRRFLPLPVTDMSLGCYVGSLSVLYERVTDFTWDEARHTKAIIDDTMDKKGRDMPVAYLGYIEDMHEWLSQKLGKKRTGAFELSNVGKVCIEPKAAEFKMESLVFSQSASACSAAIKISTVTGPDGRLVLGYTWQDEVVEDKMIDQIKRYVQYQVSQLISP